MFASGCWLVIVRWTGKTTSELGAIPKLHIIIAPLHTCIAITWNVPQALAASAASVVLRYYCTRILGLAMIRVTSDIRLCVPLY
jgi:hypothetical protein